MTTTEMFSDFLGNLKIDIKQAKKISYHYRKITRALNKSFRSSESPVANRLKVGSVGRHTAIKGISDLDMLYIMPGGLYDVYNNMCNGQSRLLTHVRDALSAIYPDQEVRKDRLVVQVIFKHFQVEVQPVFRQDNGDFWYPESYGGGAWKVTRPSEEIAAMTAFSRTKSNNLRRLCKMVRAWKNRNGVNMGGLLIDTLVWRFLSSTNLYDTASLARFDVLSRDFFAFLAAETRQSRYHALGSGQHVKVKSPWFGRAARQAFDLCEKAIAATDEESKHALWRSVYGRAFPARPKPVLESFNTAGMESLNQRLWRDTEEFIEDRFPVDIRGSLDMECVISQDGFRADRLSEFLRRGFRLSHRKSLQFSVEKANLQVQEPYRLYWKVLNVGPEARRRDDIRGQILNDNGTLSRRETTSFRGDHIVECYLVKNDVVVARQSLLVPIE